ncbi:carboxypeptidase M32 [Francisella tularensis subsp. novicida]|uniref:Metal-dependent carboxypeptidase n=2 Tax=Francisella tularensis TaxID=263 RepID=A0A6I4RWI5_FRATU|nr:carboxypeptidase M32 [Francisella tularensis]ABK90590.1 metallocarboxypeptidase [Francisella tularensis subsp. novicida U112]MBK2035497.1 carboxypeptidase M32 [Francisella tularensis subsp. novicida]MBK2116115.1 carboxypeptidase M32 [Francisella tularensis subsp. novicida]MBK2311326.1 carboxypeptidase M32 [Francisella tularensis subsp. novicida]MBK2316058.1 carboxypeptidase M32 [Francisella tularensis subsp. novicida]
MSAIKSQLQILQDKLSQKKKYNHAISLMHWDLETQAPKNSINTTSEVIGFFSEKIYEITNSEEITSSLKYLNSNLSALDQINKRIVYLTTKQKDRLSKIPKDEYVAYNKLLSQAQNIWAKARKDNDFEAFAPYLEEIIKYQKKYVERIGYDEHPYDVLLDDYEEGMTVAKLEPFFDSLKERIVPLLEKIKNANQVDTSCIDKPYNIDKQKEYSHKIAKQLGFNFDSGILKESAHPFTLNFNKYDVRMTTHYIENLFTSSLFSTIHETGHAMYEQNICDNIYDTILGTGVSLGIHESQSRFYENLVGKNKAFWDRNYSELQDLFAENLADTSIEEFYKAINKVSPSLIRVEADELTYSLHILVRFEIEKEIFEKDIDIRELPKLWNDKYQKYLGITPFNFSDGILQDVHWSAGLFGYFPTYALGSAYASQIFYYMNKDFDVNVAIRDNKLELVLGFLTKHIHQFGSLKPADEIIYNMCGEYLNAKFYVEYLDDKFTKIYNLK